MLGLGIKYYSDSSLTKFESAAQQFSEFQQQLLQKDSIVTQQLQIWKARNRQSQKRIIPILDTLGRSIPSTIHLEKLTYRNVLQQEFFEAVEVSKKVIEIQGIAVSKRAFNPWIETLKKHTSLQRLSTLVLESRVANRLHFTIQILVRYAP